MRRKKRILILFALVIFLFNIAEVKAAHVGCNSTITSNIFLDSDIGPCQTNGINIGADNIILECNSHIIKGNTQATRGVYIENKRNVTVKNCNIQNFSSGIMFSSSNSSTILNNVLTSNSNEGIWIYISSFNTVANNTASGGYSGISLSFSSTNNFISSNTLNSNSYFGISVSSSNNILDSNTVNSNTRGIFIYPSSNFNNLTNNIAKFNSGYGIRTDSAKTLIKNNTLESNAIGIGLVSSNFSSIINNTAVSNSDSGIRLFLSSNFNIITSNIIISNFYGISSSSAPPSNSNKIYNNFFDNQNNVLDNSFNFWNTTQTLGTNIVGGPYTGGNFWSNYLGNDTNSDGIGDTNIPYNSSGNIQNNGDYLPLHVHGPVMTS